MNHLTPEDRLNRLLATLRGAEEALILVHNDPDPDAIGSAVALRYLLAEKRGLDATIIYRGIVGRSENRALVRYLDNPLRRAVLAELRRPLPVILVDTQPGAGNNALPPKAVPAVVIDHHPEREESAAVPFADIRPNMGATSTMMTEYLQAARLEPPPPVATALFYGIKSDTLGLTRGATPADLAAYTYLQPLIDVEALLGIERAQVPADYFKGLVGMLRSARLYDGVAVSYLGSMSRSDLAAEMADLLLRLRGVRWVICMGAYKDVLILAVRTRTQGGRAERLVQRIVGEEGSAGGHGRMAGGQVCLDGRDPKHLARRLRQRALHYLKVSDVPGERLI